MSIPLAEKLAAETTRLIEWLGVPTRPQKDLTDDEYNELLDSFSPADLHLSDDFRNKYTAYLKRRFAHVMPVNVGATKDKYFTESIRGMADYFLVADLATKRGYAVTLAHARRPISIKLVTS